MIARERPVAIVLANLAGPAMDALAKVCTPVLWADACRPDAPPDVRNAAALVTVSVVPMPADLLQRFPQVTLIAFLGAGYDSIVPAEWWARGVAVSNVPAVNDGDVADLAIGLMIAAVRGIAAGDRHIRAGNWTGRLGVALPRSIASLRGGIVGLGAIGTAIARRLVPMGVEIMWWGPSAKPDARWPRTASLLDLARHSDVLFIAARGSPANTHLVDAAVLSALGPDGYLINVARGSLVDERALADALRSGGLAGAGLDVFEREPTPAARWHGIENVVLTPHVGGWARDSIERAGAVLSDNLLRHFTGRPLLTPVPPEPVMGPLT